MQCPARAAAPSRGGGGGGGGGGGVSSPLLSLCCLWTLTLCFEACLVEFNQTLHLPTHRSEVRPLSLPAFVVPGDVDYSTAPSLIIN